MSSQPTANELEPLYAQRHEPEDVAAALAALALCGGNANKAHQRLQAAGIDISPRTLNYWRTDRFPERYEHTCKELAPRVEAQIVDFQRELAVQASEAAQQAVALEVRRLAAGEVKDAASSARNLATTAGIAVDKTLSLTGRPTQITEHRTPEQAMKRLQTLHPSLFVEGSAEELAPAEAAQLPASS